MLHFFVVLVMVVGTGLVESLEHFDKFREGSCKSIAPFQTVDVDPRWMAMLRNIPAGNKYYMYRMASAHSLYPTMRESEFYYDFCLQRNTTLTPADIVSVFGFGQTLASFDVRVGATDLKNTGVYLEAIPRSNNYNSKPDILRSKIALTDYETFAVLINCWIESDQKGWNVVSLVPTLSKKTQEKIKTFIKSLGFEEENSIFIRYDSCSDLENSETETGNELEAKWTQNAISTSHSSSMLKEMTLAKAKERIFTSAIRKPSKKLLRNYVLV